MADLIDRAALLVDIDKLHEHCGHCDGYGYISKDKAMEKVKAAPTIEAKPVVHGEWEKAVISFHDCFTDEYWDEFYYEHKECGCQSEHKHKFCPNCGADMRERKGT